VGSSPKEKPLRTTSFVLQVSRAAIRDRKTRRKTMLVLLVLALLFLFSGSTFLQSALDPREYPGWFILFWAICAWLTLAAILLAVFDLLIVKLEGRQNERTLREKFLRSANQDSPRSTTSE
jgi:protein-S-isoprenylcysteine O-methyltransferase Ste14